MAHRDFLPPAEKNGLVHPPSCVCVKCSAGREARQLDVEMKERVRQKLDDCFLEAVAGNLIGGFQALVAGQPVAQVRAGFLGNMEKILIMRETAAAYFSE